MKITRSQLRRIIKEDNHLGPDQEIPIQFTSECMESIDILIGEGNAQGMSFPDIIGEIQRCLDVLSEGGW